MEESERAQDPRNLTAPVILAIVGELDRRLHRLKVRHDPNRGDT